MDSSLVEAFKKLEAKLQNEKDRALRKEREEILRLSQEALEKERKKQERLVYAAALSFLLAIFFLVYYANEAQIRASGGVGAWMTSKVEQVSLASLAGKKQDEIDCGKPENWKLPVCVEERKDEVSSKWQNMALNKGSKESAFAIAAPK